MEAVVYPALNKVLTLEIGSAIGLVLDARNDTDRVDETGLRNALDRDVGEAMPSIDSARCMIVAA